jgi:hypothetical protein
MPPGPEQRPATEVPLLIQTREVHLLQARIREEEVTPARDHPAICTALQEAIHPVLQDHFMAVVIPRHPVAAVPAAEAVAAEAAVAVVAVVAAIQAAAVVVVAAIQAAAVAAEDNPIQ